MSNHEQTMTRECLKEIIGRVEEQRERIRQAVEILKNSGRYSMAVDGETCEPVDDSGGDWVYSLCVLEAIEVIERVADGINNTYKDLLKVETAVAFSARLRAKAEAAGELYQFQQPAQSVTVSVPVEPRPELITNEVATPDEYREFEKRVERLLYDRKPVEPVVLPVSDDVPEWVSPPSPENSSRIS